MWFWSIHRCFHWCKKYKNWPRNARVVVENKAAPFQSGHGVVILTKSRIGGIIFGICFFLFLKSFLSVLYPCGKIYTSNDVNSDIWHKLQKKCCWLHCMFVYRLMSGDTQVYWAFYCVLSIVYCLSVSV